MIFVDDDSHDDRCNFFLNHDLNQQIRLALFAQVHNIRETSCDSRLHDVVHERCSRPSRDVHRGGLDKAHLGEQRS